jgi:tight adherence protein B
MAAVAWAGALCCAVALGIVVLLLAGPRRTRVPLSRLDPSARAARGRLSAVGEGTVALAERALRRLGNSRGIEEAVEKAGLQVRPADVLVITGGGAVAAGALGLLLSGPLAALLLVAVAPAAAVLVIGRRQRRRQKLFREQLDDSLQLMSSSLRAGHSVLRALDAVSRDTEIPTSVEFSRVVNETRAGRDLNTALEEVAARTGSDDFAWVVQAIAIHREVGGNLAEVLDRVGATIRERNELRREALALSAEGRVSGVVLLVMPVAVVLVLMSVAPGYLAPLTGTGTGRVLLALSAALMVGGAVWLKSIVKVRF